MAHPGRHAAERPDDPAVIMAGGDRGLSWRELDRAAVAVANAWYELGLRPGDPVGWCLENRPEFLVLLWAAQYSGLRYTPLSTRLSPDEIAYVVDNCGARILMVSHRTRPIVSAGLDGPDAPRSIDVDEEWSRLTASAGEPARFERVEGISMLFSSGTTGRPKGIWLPLPVEPVASLPMRDFLMGRLYGIDADSVYLSPAPLYHAAPLSFVLTMGRLGAACVVMERFDAKLALELIERHRVTHSQWVPTMFFRMLRLAGAERERWDLSSHHVAIHGAAPCPIPVKEQMMDWWGPILHEYYAGSEGVGTCIIGPEEWLAHKGSVGRPVNSRVQIRDDEGRELPPGEIGQIWFDNCRQFEYHADPEQTAEARTADGQGTFGDVGYLDEEGYLYLTDRKSFTIISGGVNIYPQEAEDVLVTHPLVADAAVFGIPSPEWGEEVKAAVELIEKAEPSAALARELIGYCRARLSHIKCPRSVDFELSLPRQPNGKLYKRVLQDRYRHTVHREV